MSPPDPFDTIRAEVAALWAERGSRAAEVHAWSEGWGDVLPPSDDPATLARALCVWFAGVRGLDDAWDGLQAWRDSEAPHLARLRKVQKELDAILPALADCGRATPEQAATLSATIAAILVEPEPSQRIDTMLGKALMSLLIAAGYRPGKRGDSYTHRRAADLSSAAAEKYKITVNADTLYVGAHKQQENREGEAQADSWALLSGLDAARLRAYRKANS